MAMTSLNISLPEQMKSYVESQTEDGDYSTPSEYIRDLIRQDKARRLAELEASLVESDDDQWIDLPMDELTPETFLPYLQGKLRELEANDKKD